MKMNELGQTGIQVSDICLGTMTFGEQNTEADAHAQLDMAFDHGVNLIDTAEMYAFPARAETQGLTEAYVGSWLKARGTRDKVVLATKITGPGGRFNHIRDGQMRFDHEQVRRAVDGSLKRLQTDYIDLYQTHWPERPSNYFGKLGYAHDDNEADWTPFEETLAAIADEIKAGRIRAFGVSNESAWGLMAQLRLSDSGSLPRVASVQNAYSLICRQFEVGLAETAIRENCGLLAYSPLAFGALSGKYLDGDPPAGSRIQRFPAFQRYFKPKAVEATAAYVKLARDHGLDPAQMAIAFVRSRRFATSTIIGATSLDQLRDNLGAGDMTLPADILTVIEAIHTDNPNPGP